MVAINDNNFSFQYNLNREFILHGHDLLSKTFISHIVSPISVCWLQRIADISRQFGLISSLSDAAFITL